MSAVKFDTTLNWNIAATFLMIVLSGTALYFGLDKSVAVLGTNVEGKLNTAEQRVNGQVANVQAQITGATSRVDGQVQTINTRLDTLTADRGRLEANVTQLNNLVITRSDSRYSKLDAQRDADAVAKRFDELLHRMDRFEEINVEQDKKLEELQRLTAQIANAISAVRLPMTQHP